MFKKNLSAYLVVLTDFLFPETVLFVYSIFVAIYLSVGNEVLRLEFFLELKQLWIKCDTD